MWQCFTFDTVSGLLRKPLDVPALSWRVTVADCSLSTTRGTDVGEGEGSGLRVPWSALQGADAASRDFELAPLRRGVVLMLDGAPVVAGAIGGRVDTWLDTSFSLRSPMDLLEQRVVCPEGAFGRGPGSTTVADCRWEGRSLRAIAALVVQNAMGKPGGSLPIDVAHYAGERGGHERTYKGFNASNNAAAKLLDAITNVEGGPDMQFRPYLADATHLRWRLEAGSDGSPRLSSSGLVPVLTCHPGGGTLQDVQVAHLAPVMRVYGTGTGGDEATLCHLASDTALCSRQDPWPLAETALSGSADWDSAALVREHAAGRLEASKRPMVQIAGTVNAFDPDCPVRPGTFWPGQEALVDLDGFPTLPDGRYRLRVMEMAGDLGGTVRVTFDQMVDPWEGGAYAPQ